MAQVLFAKRQLNLKVAYYGPPGAGKRANLGAVHERSAGRKSPLNSIEHEGEQATYFNLFPEWLERIRGLEVCLQLFSVPGAVFWETFPHRLVLQGADAVVFVADSSPDALDANVRAWRALEENLRVQGEELASFPVVFQWNKRDLPDALAVGRLQETLNARGAPAFEAAASEGRGVEETLRAVGELAASELHDTLAAED